MEEDRKLVIILNSGYRYSAIASKSYAEMLFSLIKSMDSPEFLVLGEQDRVTYIRVRDISVVEINPPEEERYVHIEL